MVAGTIHILERCPDCISSISLFVSSPLRPELSLIVWVVLLFYWVKLLLCIYMRLSVRLSDCRIFRSGSNRHDMTVGGPKNEAGNETKNKRLNCRKGLCLAIYKYDGEKTEMSCVNSQIEIHFVFYFHKCLQDGSKWDILRRSSPCKVC